MHNSAMRAKSSFMGIGLSLALATIIIFLLLMAAAIVVPKTVDGLGMLLFKGELRQINSPYQGVLTSWGKEEGDRINEGDVIATMLTHHSQESVLIRAPSGGVIAEIIAYSNTVLEKGQAIAIIAHDGDPRADLELVGFVSSLDGKKIQPGMTALIDPSVTSSYQHGKLLGSVKRVGKLPMSKSAILSMLKIPEVADYIRSQLSAEPFFVVVQLQKDDHSLTGYQWTGPGPRFVLDSGVFARMTITYEENNLLRLLWPVLTGSRVER